MLKSRGFAHQLLLLCLVVLAAVAVVGWRVAMHDNHSSVSYTSGKTSKTSSKTAALQQSVQQLDTDKGSSQLDPTQLDSDINQLL